MGTLPLCDSSSLTWRRIACLCPVRTATIAIRGWASRDRCRGRGRWPPGLRRFRFNLRRRPPSRRPAASACEGVRPRVPADFGRALCYAAGLDGAGTPRGLARGDSGSPGPDRGAAGAQSIELGGNRARLRSTVQAGGGAIELARRCRGAPLAALVPGQGGGSKRLCIGRWLDTERQNRHLHYAFTRRAWSARALNSLASRVSSELTNRSTCHVQ